VKLRPRMARSNLHSKLEAAAAQKAQVHGRGGGPGRCDPTPTVNWREMEETVRFKGRSTAAGGGETGKDSKAPNLGQSS
jgi:hypothetical protein